jgi:outer membrane protein OmpA-like peptidoglycan-associated protein
MKEARFRYFKGRLTSQFLVDKVKDRHGPRFGDIVLQPRHYLGGAQEVSEEAYKQALASRLSEDSIAWQQQFIGTEDSEKKEFQIHPHVLQKGETLVEMEPEGETSFAVLADEIYAEFPQGNPDEAYRGWEFVAQKDGQFHGRISGNAWCRILELDPEEKRQKLAAISRKENFLPSDNNGCLPSLIPAAGCNPISLFAGGGCLSGGCSQLGCGLLSLLGLLAAILSLFRSCQSETEKNTAPRVIHDTVYVKDGMQVKEFVDSAFVNKTDAILLPNVQFYTNSARLLPYSIRPIQELAAYLDSHPDVNAVIKGHTDDVGEEAANLQLSQARAEAVRSVLISLGISPDRVKAVGYGESVPKVRGQSVEARALNRRVEVELINTSSVDIRRTEKTKPKP